LLVDRENLLMNQNTTLVDVAVAHGKTLANQLVYTFLANGETIENQLTFQQLDQSARSIAANLQLNYHLTKGDRVVLLFCPGLQFLEAFFGCLYAGIIAVPVYPPGSGTTWANYLSIVDNANASIILADTTKTKFLLRHFNVTKQESPIPIVDLGSFDISLSAGYVKPEISPSDLALLQYTSGTTSLPKGVMITHGNIMHNEQLINQQITGGYKIGVSWLPLYHDMGLFGSVLQAMYVGGHCILMPPTSFLIKPYRWLKVISDNKANISGCPNFAFDLCVEAIDESMLDSLDLSHWKVAASGAEPVQAATLRRFADKFGRCGFSANSYVPCYGLAESTLLACANKMDPFGPPTILAVSKKQLANRIITDSDDQLDQKEFVSCGKPEKNSIIAVDNDSKQLMPEDRIGELWLRGSSVAVGYWQDAEKTAEVFNFEIDGYAGFYRTGDLGFLHNGEVYITGRIKDLIIIHGKNHYPSDIERTIQNSDAALALDSGAVFTVEVNGVERVIVAQEVVYTAVAQLNSDELINKIKSLVTKEHEIQVHGVILLKPGKIEKTSSGKVKRRAIREAYLSGALTSESDAIANWKTMVLTNFLSNRETVKQEISYTDIDVITTEVIEQRLIEWVANKLNLDTSEIDPKASHSSLGLDSVDVMSLFGEVEKWLGMTIDPESLSLWELETLDDIARVLYEATQNPAHFSQKNISAGDTEGFI